MRRAHVLIGLGGIAIGSFALACSDASLSSSPAESFVNADAGPDEAVPERDASAAPDAPSPEASSGEHTVAISAGGYTACALSSAGRVACWGDNAEGELVLEPKPGKTCSDVGGGTVDCDPRLPTVLALPHPVLELDVGHLSTCAIFDDGGTRKLGCWGNNNEGELTTNTSADFSASVVMIPLPSAPKHVRSGKYFKLVELEDGTIWGWGDNAYGQFGGSKLDAISVPEKIFPTGDITDAGKVLDFSTSALDTYVLAEGGLYGVGDNTSGEQMVPNPPEEVHVMTKLAIGSAGAPARLHRGTARAYGQCYIDTEGKAWCWGDNSTGQLGRIDVGVSSVSPVAVPLPAGNKVAGISQGRGNACAVLDEGSVYCWGDNQGGQCGQPSSGDFVEPAAVPGLANITQVSAGFWFFTCALSAEHRTYCWGDGSYGQLGIATDGGLLSSATPIEVPIAW